LQQLRRHTGAEGAVIRSERGGSRGMRPGSVVNWFRRLYHEIGLRGCSPHSGRRTFITNAARLVFKAGGSLRDAHRLAARSSKSRAISTPSLRRWARDKMLDLITEPSQTRIPQMEWALRA
jgi:integrase